MPLFDGLRAGRSMLSDTVPGGRGRTRPLKRPEAHTGSDKISAPTDNFVSVQHMGQKMTREAASNGAELVPTASYRRPCTTDADSYTPPYLPGISSTYRPSRVRKTPAELLSPYPPVETASVTVSYRALDLQKGAQEKEKEGWSFVEVRQTSWFADQTLIFDRNNSQTYSVVVKPDPLVIQQKKAQVIKERNLTFEKSKIIGSHSTQLIFRHRSFYKQDDFICGINL